MIKNLFHSTRTVLNRTFDQTPHIFPGFSSKLNVDDFASFASLFPLESAYDSTLKGKPAITLVFDFNGDKRSFSFEKYNGLYNPSQLYFEDICAMFDELIPLLPESSQQFITNSFYDLKHSDYSLRNLFDKYYSQLSLNAMVDFVLNSLDIQNVRLVNRTRDKLVLSFDAQGLKDIYLSYFPSTTFYTFESSGHGSSPFSYAYFESNRILLEKEFPSISFHRVVRNVDDAQLHSVVKAVVNKFQESPEEKLVSLFDKNNVITFE